MEQFRGEIGGEGETTLRMGAMWVILARPSWIGPLNQGPQDVGERFQDELLSRIEAYHGKTTPVCHEVIFGSFAILRIRLPGPGGLAEVRARPRLSGWGALPVLSSGPAGC
jgi:hypothetical protein